MLKSSLNDENKKVEKMQLLLAKPEDKKVIDFMRSMSPNNKLVEMENMVGEKIIKDKYTEEYATTFTQREIFKEAMKYNLAFVSAKEYTGDYSKEYREKVYNFVHEKNLMQSEHDAATQIYVLAPAKTDVNGKVLQDNLCDPMVFYKVENGYYILIVGRKDYINMWNRYKAIKHYDEFNCRMFYTLENILIGLVIFYGIQFLAGKDWSNLWLILVLFCGIVAQFVRMGIKESHTVDFTHSQSYFLKHKYTI